MLGTGITSAAFLQTEDKQQVKDMQNTWML
jgi:hypothetical protein